MGSLLFFTIIAIQLSGSLGTHPIPLKCFLKDGNALNVFDHVLASSYETPTIKSLPFGAVTANKVNFDKDAWWHDADTVEYEGLENSILDEFGINLVTDVVHITFHTDMYLTYPYRTNGSLFSKPIYGEGVAKVFLKNIQFDLTMPFDIIEANGNKHIELKNFVYWYNVVDKAEFSFSNLYNGNKELSDSMHKLLNENWKFITSNFGKVFMNKVAENVFNVFKKYTLDMSLKDSSSC